MTSTIILPSTDIKFSDIRDTFVGPTGTIFILTYQNVTLGVLHANGTIKLNDFRSKENVRATNTTITRTMFPSIFSSFEGTAWLVVSNGTSYAGTVNLYKDDMGSAIVCNMNWRNPNPSNGIPQLVVNNRNTGGGWSNVYSYNYSTLGIPTNSAWAVYFTISGYVIRLYNTNWTQLFSYTIPDTGLRNNLITEGSSVKRIAISSDLLIQKMIKPVGIA